MDLQTSLHHKRSTKVLVNGTVYEIDADGIIHNVKDADAKRMLSGNSIWRPRAKREPMKPQVQEEAPSAPAPVAEPLAAPAPEPEVLPEEPKLVVEAPTTEPPAPVAEKPDAGEWPEPTPEMDINYLRKMADAYEVKYTKKTTSQMLVNAIKMAMYGDEKGM